MLVNCHCIIKGCITFGVILSNSVINDDNQDSIKKPELIIPTKFVAVGTTSTVTITLERGSHCTYQITFGDGTSLTLENSDFLAFRTPLLVTHNYNLPGNYTIDLAVSNDISTAYAVDSIFVQNSISSIQITAPSVIPFPPGLAHIEVAIGDTDLTLRNVFLDIDFGNDQRSQFYVDSLSKTQPFVTNKQYFMSDIGAVSVSANCSNAVSHLEKSTQFVLQRVLKGLTIETLNYTLETGDHADIRIEITAGSHLLYDINFGDGNFVSGYELNSVGGPFSRLMSHRYEVPGLYQITVFLRNDVGNLTSILEREISVQNPVQSLVLNLVSSKSDTEDVISMPDGILEYETAYIGAEEQSPTEVTCIMAVDDIYSNSSSVQKLSRDSPLILVYHLPELSQKTLVNVTVACFNKISRVQLSRSVNIQRSVDSVTFVPDKFNIPVNGSVLFDIRILGGSDLTISLSYGTGMNDVIQQISWFENEFILQRLHRYEHSKATPYQAILSVSNKVYQNEISLNINVVERITGLNFLCFYYVSEISNSKSYGEGPLGNIFPQERIIWCEASTESGNFLTYEWIFEEGQSQVSGNPGRHWFLKAGNHTIALKVKNPLYVSSMALDIEIYQTILLKEILTNGPKDAYNPINLTLVSFWPGTKSCFKWDVGDGSPSHVYGGTHCSLQVGPSEKFTSMEPEKSIDHSHTYTKEGEFAVTVTAWNLLSNASVATKAVIRKINCGYPAVNILGDGRNHLYPLASLRSEWINLESNVIPNCSVSDVALFNWTVERIIDGATYRDRRVERFPVDQLSTDKFQVAFPPRTFPPGTYRVTLEVAMAVLPVLSASDQIHIKVSPSPLTVKIDGGSARSAGFNSILTMDAVSVTIDPDVGIYDKTGMEFEWFCIRQGEELTRAENGTILDAFIELPDPEQKANLTGSGCFRTGIGKLRISSGIARVDTFLLDPGSTNYFVVQVRKGAKFGIFRQEIQVVDGIPPSIAIV